MNLLALDCSTKSTGLSIYRHNKLIEYDCITSASTDLFTRIDVMVQNIRSYLQNNLDIDHVVLEQVRQEGFMNIKTYKALMYLQGCVCMMIHKNFKHIQIDFMYPSQWRKVCQIKQGRGIKREKQKENDIQWVKDRFKITVNDDVADAIGLGYAYIFK